MYSTDPNRPFHAHTFISISTFIPVSNRIAPTPHRYKPPGASEVRTIPLEIFVKQDAEPMYGTTTEDDGRGYSATRLPFQAYGTLGAYVCTIVCDSR